jgi:surfeit locus 1 family protein
MSQGLPFYGYRSRYQFKLKRGFGLLCLMIISLCCVLGNWQLHRYHYKKNLLATFQQNNQAEAIPLLRLQGVNAQATQFKPVAVSGRYRNDLTVVLQNRSYQNKMGFEVLTPLALSGEKKLIWIDRGWIPQKNNQAVPFIAAAVHPENITGTIKLLNEYQFILGNNILNANSMPRVLQKMDIKALSELTHEDYYPFILRLNPKAQDGFTRDWPLLAVMPERHLGYAVQWFVMAMALAIAYFCFCCERVKHADKQ